MQLKDRITLGFVFLFALGGVQLYFLPIAAASSRCEEQFRSISSARNNSTQSRKEARASALRQRLQAWGDQLIGGVASGQRVQVDVLVIGAGPLTAAFAANYRGGRLLVLEDTNRAGSFDKGRGLFMMNTSEPFVAARASRPSNPMPGAPVSIHDVFANPEIHRIVKGDQVFLDAEAEGDVTLEALVAARAPVRFNTAVTQIDRDNGSYIIKTNSDLIVEAKRVVIGGQGRPRDYLSRHDESYRIFEADKGEAYRRVLFGDNIILEQATHIAQRGYIVVTGDSYGAMSVIIQLLKSSAAHIVWVGSHAPNVAKHSVDVEGLEIYRPILDAIANGRVSPIDSQTLMSYEADSKTAVGVKVQHKNWRTSHAIVNQHIIAIGYDPSIEYLLGPSIDRSRLAQREVYGKLLPIGKVVTDKEIPIALRFDDIYLMGFRQRGLDSGMDPRLAKLGLSAHLDYTLLAASLARSLSTKPEIELEITKTPHVEKVIANSSSTSELVNESNRFYAELDLRRELGSIFMGTKVSDGMAEAIAIQLRTDAHYISAEFVLVGANQESKLGGVNVPKSQSILDDPTVQTAASQLLQMSSKERIVIRIPLHLGIPVLDLMTLELQ